MNKNKLELPIYKSQANQRDHLTQKMPRLYGSGATITSNHKSPTKLTLQQHIRQEPQRERAIDSQSNLTRQSTAFYKGSIIQRSKSGEPVKWQSPSKQNIGQKFKNIIEQINQQNEKTFCQLDQDLKRIKSNLNKIEQESVQAHQSSQYQVLSQEIQLLQEENQRLRQKNQTLINEKKKMSQQIDQYQSLIQREKIRQMTSGTHKNYIQQNKGEELMNNLRKLKSQLQQKEMECQKLKSINAQLSNIKAVSQKRQSLLNEEKNKLLSKLTEAQKEKDMIQLKCQQELKAQLQKKDKHFNKIIKSQQNRYEETITKLKESAKKYSYLQQQQIFSQNRQQIQRLNSQLKKLKDYQRQFKTEEQKLIKTNNQYCRQIQGLNSQIQVLSFSYKQTYEQLAQKEQQTYQYKQKNQSLSAELKKISEQMTGLKQKFQEQNKKSSFLQQLCTKIQRQSQQYQYQARNSEARLNEFIRVHEHEVEKYRITLQSIKQQNGQLQQQIYQLTKTNQQNFAQIRKKAQQIINLKKQNLVLMSETKNIKMQNAVSPPKHELSPQTSQYRLQRLHSARQSREQIYKQKEISKMRKIQRQLNDLIVQCKLQHQKSKLVYRQKEMKYQNSINSQKLQIDDLNHKIQQLQKDIQAKSSQINNQQQVLKDNLRKKDDQLLQKQKKHSQVILKLNFAQAENHQLKKKLNQFSSKQNQFNHNECAKKVQQAKQQNKRIMDTILNQITTITNSNQYDSQFMKVGLHLGFKQIKTYDQIQKMAQINYAMHNLRQKIKSLHSKMKQSQSTKMIENHHSFLLDKSSLVEQNHKSLTIKRHQYQQSPELEKKLLKATQMQKKYQRQLLQSKEQNKEIQQLHEETRTKKRQIGRLKNQIENHQDQKEELKLKIKSLQQRLNKKQLCRKNQPIHENQLLEFVTPTKQSNFYRPSFIQAERQAQQNKLRSRVRSFRSCDKRQTNGEEFKDYQRKIVQYQMNLAKANRELTNNQERIQQLQQQKHDLGKKLKKCQGKYQDKVKQYDHLQQNYQKQAKVKTQLQQKINELQHQLKILVQQLDTMNQNNLSTDLYQRQNLQKQYKQLITEKEHSIKRLKNEHSHKQLQYSSAIQQYEAKINEIKIQNNRKISDLTMQLQSWKQKYQQSLSKLQRKEQKILRIEQQITQLRQKVQRQQKQKESMLSIFSNNTNRLTKILQQKQLQIEQLKFIQQSTIINLQYARNQHKRRKQSDNSYSFKQQY